MRFTDFKIVIDGKLEGDEDAESIKSIFGKVEKKEDERRTKKQTGEKKQKKRIKGRRRAHDGREGRAKVLT